MATVHVYGMRLRGFAPGTCPMEGCLGAEEDPVPDGYWSLVVYNRKLDRKEAEAFDLDYVGRREVQ